MTEQSLAFIGGGNMARSLVGGLLARGMSPQLITVADPVQSQLQDLAAQYSVRTTLDNALAVAAADIVVLAVKPQDLRAVVGTMAAQFDTRKPLLISIAAGIRASDIERWSAGAPVVRCMPNRPALQGCGITALFAHASVSCAQRAMAERILNAVGATLWLQRESDMDAVTAVSGSGPAYFFLLIEMLEQAGIELGLPADVSRKLATHTAHGSGMMARDANESPATLRQQVTSKGGTTEAALDVLESADVRAVFSRALAAAARRSAELADRLGRD